MQYLTPTDLIVIHELLIAAFGGMRGITEAGFGRLEAAAAAPRLSAFGADVYAETAEKAAALCHAIIRSHPFSDGNKRVALAALDVFLELNSYDLRAANDAAYTVIMALASGAMGHEELVGWVERHSVFRYSV